MLKIQNIVFSIAVPPLKIDRQKPNVKNYNEVL